VRCGKTNSPEPGIFSRQIRRFSGMSKLGFPKSDPSLEVISLDHGLEAPCHEAESRTVI